MPEIIENVTRGCTVPATTAVKSAHSDMITHTEERCSGIQK
jgi:hypothetical protein